MARHFLVEAVREVERAGSGLLRFFIILVVALVATFAALVAAGAQTAFPNDNDALAKFRWEQNNFVHYCVVGAVRADRFENLSPIERAILGEATQEQLIRAIKSRCKVPVIKASADAGAFPLRYGYGRARVGTERSNRRSVSRQDDHNLNPNREHTDARAHPRRTDGQRPAFLSYVAALIEHADQNFGEPRHRPSLLPGFFFSLQLLGSLVWSS